MQPAERGSWRKTRDVLRTEQGPPTWWSSDVLHGGVTRSDRTPAPASEHGQRGHVRELTLRIPSLAPRHWWFSWPGWWSPFGGGARKLIEAVTVDRTCWDGEGREGPPGNMGEAVSQTAGLPDQGSKPPRLVVEVGPRGSGGGRGGATRLWDGYRLHWGLSCD